MLRWAESLPWVTIGATLALLFPTSANADCDVGNRIFATPLSVDDPCVDDELSLSIARFNTVDNPPATEWEFPGEYFKSITENFGVSIVDAWVRRQLPHNDSHEGFDNLGTEFLQPPEPLVRAFFIKPTSIRSASKLSYP